MCPPMGQLSSMLQHWFHIPLHAENLCECSVKAVNTVPNGTTATPQALTRHCFLMAQPALPPPAQCMQPTSTEPATLVTQMKQAPAVPAKPAVQKNASTPMPVTSHATSVKPQRSGHAHMAPRCLIQEIQELSTQTVHGPCYCNVPLSTSPFICRVNCIVSYSQKGGYYHSFPFKDWSLSQLISLCSTYISVSHFSWHMLSGSHRARTIYICSSVNKECS